MPQPNQPVRAKGAPDPAAANDPRPPPDAANTTASERAPSADAHEDALRAAYGLRELLMRGVVITGDLLQETVDEAVRRGSLTRRDAEDLIHNLLQISRRQTQDALADVETFLSRSSAETRDRIKGAAVAARLAPGADRALRTVDRARRAAGLGPSFPIIRYDELTAAQVKGRLGDLSSAELRKVRDHERRNANRKSVLDAIEKQLA